MDETRQRLGDMEDKLHDCVSSTKDSSVTGVSLELFLEMFD